MRFIPLRSSLTAPPAFTASLGAMLALTCFGCQPAQQSQSATAPETLDPVDELRVSTQQLGEASTPLYTPGTGLEPDYRARVMGWMYNRFRMAPHLYGLTFRVDMNSPPQPYIPVPPARLDAFMTEPGRWAAQFNEQTGCDCSAAEIGYSVMNRMPEELEPVVGATCCELDVVGGVAQCISPLVPCDNPKATHYDRRWAKLNQGASRITGEGITPLEDPVTAEAKAIVSAARAPNTRFGEGPFLLSGLSTTGINLPGSAIGASIMESVQVPDECIPPPAQCAGGLCADQNTGMTVCDKVLNPQCLGLCSGGIEDGEPCELPEQASGMPEECDPETFPIVETVILATGQTRAPVPVLTDGIHAQLGLRTDGLPRVPDGVVFYPTPEGQTTFAVHYYETNGTPQGTPQSIQVVLDGTCQDLNLYPVPTTLPATNNAPAPYSGDLYTHDQVLTEGCHPYVFVAKDGVGFEYTYPTYGALQAKIDAEGKVALNDDTCPIWTDTRPNLSCIPAPQECDAGETRPCYTGLYGTQDNGVCAPGLETCSGGRWSGACEDQILPEAIDICHDGKDNDCNGGIDEDCTCNWKDSVYGVCFNAPKSPERECVAPETYEEAETLCDGLDNDCDGITDENCPCDFNDAPEGVCTIAERNDIGECLEPEGFEAQEASCDDLDNDCDGVIDEGCACDYLNTTEGVCASQLRAETGECSQPERYEAEETTCDGRDNDCDGETDEDCESNCETSLDCRWEDGHGCEGRTGAGEKFCVTDDGTYRDARNAPATANPECIDDSDCNGLCDPYGLTCVNNLEEREPSSPKTPQGDDLCGSPKDCPVGYTCQSREGIRQCVSPEGELYDPPGCGGCQSTNGGTPLNLPLLGLFGLIVLARRRRERRQRAA